MHFRPSAFKLTSTRLLKKRKERCESERHGLFSCLFGQNPINIYMGLSCHIQTTIQSSSPELQQAGVPPEPSRQVDNALLFELVVRQTGDDGFQSEHPEAAGSGRGRPGSGKECCDWTDFNSVSVLFFASASLIFWDAAGPRLLRDRLFEKGPGEDEMWWRREKKGVNKDAPLVYGGAFLWRAMPCH